MHSPLQFYLKRPIHRVLRQCGYEVRSLTARNSRLEIYDKAYNADALEERRFYNIGAGAFRHPYWTNIDYENDWYKADRENTRRGIQHDLFSSTPIPIKDGSGELAYTSHTIEHLTDDVALRLFSEVYRFLKPGGYFRIVAPDALLAYRAYVRSDRNFFTWIEDYSDPKRMKAMALAGKHSEASLEQIPVPSHSMGASERKCLEMNPRHGRVRD